MPLRALLSVSVACPTPHLSHEVALWCLVNHTTESFSKLTTYSLYQAVRLASVSDNHDGFATPSAEGSELRGE
jgi:hypothetical protein